MLLKAFGKVKLIKLFQKKLCDETVFKNLKKSWDVSENLFLQLEEFTCSMYKPKDSHLTVDDLCYEIVLKKCCGKENQLNQKKSADWSSLPPRIACLRKHLKRVNYQEAIWKRARISKLVIPLPTGSNGWIVVHKVIEPK